MLPIKLEKIILPKELNVEKWAVVACDQFSSNTSYWGNLKEFVGESDSTLNLVFPEAYLSKDNTLRIHSIENSMNAYINRGVFKDAAEMIITKRTTQSGLRTGLIFAIDLEAYTFGGKESLIRATEGTILDRIPPRVEIRKACSIEFPHVMVLYDDPTDSVLKAVEQGKELYSSNLNSRGGSIEGYEVANTSAVLSKFSALQEESKNKRKSAILFAVGDGNHSLATAKACWEEEKLKASPNLKARYALVEAVNVYDKALSFHAIHRVVKSEKLNILIEMLSLGTEQGEICGFTKTDSYKFKAPLKAIDAVKYVQDNIDAFLKEQGGEVDYIHGDEEVQRLKDEENTITITLPSMSKDELFDYIVNKGVLPRKTFSMGEAEEKRYYLEGRFIK